MRSMGTAALCPNNPIRYTDPSGHCPICITAAIGAVVGGGIAYGVQVAANISQNGLTVNALTEVNWATVGAGAVAGAVGGATFGVGTAVFGTGLAGMVAAGAIRGAVAGQAARATENGLSGREITAGLGDPAQIAADAALGGAFAEVGYGIGPLAQPEVAEAAGSAGPPPLRIGRLNHQRPRRAYPESLPIEQQPCVDVDQTFTDLAGH